MEKETLKKKLNDAISAYSGSPTEENYKNIMLLVDEKECDGIFCNSKDKEDIKQFLIHSLNSYTEEILKEILPEEKEINEWTGDFFKDKPSYKTGWNDCRQTILNNFNKLNQ